MDYDDNDSQSQNLHLAGEGNNKFPSVLRSYDLPRFDFDDNLRGHLRFDSLVETEVFLGIESSEDNQWIEEFSRGSTGIAFSSSAAEPCLISRRTNVWSEAASSESVEMLLKSVGQDETTLGQTISKDSDACDELGCMIKPMDPSLKHRYSSLSKVGDDIQPALHTGEIPGKCVDNQLVKDASQTHEGDPSVHGALEDPNSKNTDIPATERDESKDSKHIVVNENLVEASVDQSLDDSGQEDKFASGSEVNTIIPSVQSTCMTSVLIDDEDSTHLKNDIIDKNVDSLERENVGLSPELHIGGKNLVDDTVACVTSHVQKHSASDMQSREEEHATGNSTANMSEPSGRILEGNSDLHMVEECSKRAGVEILLQTSKSEDIVLSEGKLHDTSSMPIVSDITLMEHENEVSDTDTIICMSLESKVNSTMKLASDAIEKKDLLESDYHPDKKISSSKSEKSLLLAEDGKGSKDEGEDSHDTLVAGPTKVCEKYIVTEHIDDHKCDRSVSVTSKQNTNLPSDCSSADCFDDRSPLVTKGVDSSSFGAGGRVNELASNLQPDVPVSCMLVDCVLLPSDKGMPANTVLDKKEVQVPSSETSFSVVKTSGMTTEKGASCETGEQFSCKIVDQSLLMKNTTTLEGENGDQTLCGVTLEVGKDMHSSSIVSDSTVRKTDGDKALVISKVSTDSAGGASTQLNKTLMSSVPSTSMEASHNTDQNHHKDNDSKLVSEEISGRVAVHQVNVDPAKAFNTSFASAPSSESQTKFHMMESGSSSADLDNPSCGSPIVIRTSEQSQGKIESGVKRSKDQSAVASGVTNEEANKEKSISQDTEGNDATPGDKSFTFEVPPLLGVSEQESGKNWKPFATMQQDKISPAMEGTPSTSGLSKAGAKAARETSCANLQAPKRENVRGGSKGTSERKTRRTGGKSASKEAAKKGNAAKERTPARDSERSDRTSNVSLSSAGTGQLVQSNEMQHYGHIEGGNMKPFGVLSTSVSSLPDLNTSASSSAVFQQPFTDLQQVQLRAQIFVYGALIQGTVPDEAYMILAFGGPDGGRTIWENAWRAGTERVHGKKSLLVSPETPLQSHIGAKTSDQSIKQNTLQSKVTSSPASRSTGKGTPTTSIVNPMIPLSSPLWSIRTPSGDALQPTGFPRGAVMDYQLAISPLHPPATRNLIGHNSSWMSQSPFRGPWTPQTSAFDGNACFPVRPITEAVNSNPAIASVPHSSSMKQVSAVPVVQSGSPANIFAGTPLLDTKKATLTPGQHSADPKPRKRKKSTVSEEPGQSIPHFQSESRLATVVVSQASKPAAITIPATNISKSTDKFITSVSGNHLKKGDQESDQRASLSEETLSKHKNAQKHAEDAAALAAAAVSHSEEIWRQLDKHKNSGLAPDVETKLTSAAVAIAAAAAVAKAAAAAANVASNAALQSKLMADEALVSSGYRNSTPNNAISDSGKRLSEATPASILRAEDAAASSNSVIVVAREVARRRVEAASAAAKQAENMDAIVKAAELAAEAVSQAGKIVAMGEPFSLAELVEAGPEAYWKVPQASPEPDGAIREQINIGGSMEAPGSSVGHLKEVPVDKREKQDNHRKSPTHREMTRVSMEDRSRLTDGGLAPVATSEKDKKGQKRRKASDVAKTKGVASESEIGFESPLMITQTDREKAGETSKDNNIREGSHVEVLRDGGGSRVAWFLADILNLNNGKAYVCYNELRQEDGDRLKEWVEVEGDRAPRIRCARPSTAMSFEGTRKRRRAAMADYNWSVGDRVDAWMQNSWWEGVVIEKSKKDETSFTVHFPAQGETSGVKAWLLRSSLMWKKGSWVEWSSSVDNNESSREGDTPQEKRQRLGSPVVEAKGKDKLSKNVDIKESGKPDDTKLLDLSANKEIFNIGKSTRDESKPDSLRMIRTGLKKKGSGVVFGVPKPGKKQKFMEVSKHYVADQSSKTHETSDSAKFTKYLMPQGSEPRGTKNKIEPKLMAVSKPKILKSGKLPSVSSRSIPQKNYLPNTMISEPDSVVASDVSKLEDSASHAENVSGKPNLMEFRSFSSSDGAAEGPVLFSSVAVSSDASLKKTPASNAKSERINKGKFAPSGGKLAKIEENVFNDDTTKTSSEGVEPRRSNRRIQPTSRLLEGLQSSLAISKIPSVSFDKSHKSQSRSMRG